GDFACRVRVLAVIAGEGEKALVRFRLRRHAGADEDDRIAEPHDYAAVRLFGDLAGFDGEFASVEIDFYCLNIHLCLVPGYIPRLSFIRRAPVGAHDCSELLRGRVSKGGYG